MATLLCQCTDEKWKGGAGEYLVLMMRTLPLTIGLRRSSRFGAPLSGLLR
ncbi:hypothetical protein [Burkholderia sp. LA-2-3-30-S1-D2]|nr:hypothetical protein [Burkholderia sp. LA-2-3-30-S1-D2]